MHPLVQFTPLSADDSSDATIVPNTPPPVPPLASLDPPHPAHIYIWTDPLSRLLPEIWDYEQFVRDNAWKWVGDGSADNQDYREVDRRREMGGEIVRTDIPAQQELVMA